MGIGRKAFLSAVSIIALPAAALAANYPMARVEYSGDYRMESQGTAMDMKVFQASDRSRTEMSQSGSDVIMIIRQDKKKAWSLMPKDKMYMEMDFDQAGKQSGNMNSCTYDATSKGSDVVNGVKADKMHAVVKCPDSSYEGNVWVTGDGITVKMDVKGKDRDGRTYEMKSEMRNLKIGRLDPALFELPSGYQSMGNVNDMMRNSQRQYQDAMRQAAEDEKKAAERERLRADEEARRNEEAKKAEEERAKRQYSTKKRAEKTPEEKREEERQNTRDNVKSNIRRAFGF